MSRFSAVLVTLAILSTGNVSANNRIIVDVYYEQLCPYSVRFITQQLVPAYKQLQDYVRVNFIPFGKASYVIGNPTNFTCQHGPAECKGDKSQACALHEIQQTGSSEDQQKLSMDVVGCIMENYRESTAVVQCSEEAGLSEKRIKRIKHCSNSNFGDDLLISYGIITKAFESPLQGVPSVALNGMKNENAIEDFLGELCHLIADNDKPAVCKQSPSKKTFVSKSIDSLGSFTSSSTNWI